MSDKAALDAALAQIDRAFGKAPADAPPRVAMKVWMDPFTEDHVFRFVREQVEAWLPSDFDSSDRMWEDIGDQMANGDHRVLEFHPFARMYPPVTVGERLGLFFRRLFGRFQRSQTEKWDAEIAKVAPPPARHAPLPSLNNPPF